MSEEDSYETLHQYHGNFENDSFYESPGSGIKILDVCELKDEQWFSDPYEKQEQTKELLWDPNFKIKDEPIDYDDNLAETSWREDYLMDQKPEISERGTQLSFYKPEFPPMKDESTGRSVPYTFGDKIVSHFLTF